MDLLGCPLALFAGLLLLWPGNCVRAQEPPDSGDGPQWVYEDSNLVERPSWISSTVAKNIVVLTFRHSTVSRRRAAIIHLVQGTIVYNDRTYNEDGNYLVR